ncbi:hypothetical protein JW949_03100 [Candidatus Woesearchaeota archaeon]|nr:hypothetical protein [Candidatus Woesearchaeota archaeon]
MKKAQAAMEFLMTYGWAILVVLAAIGALAYFGVLSPAQFLPEKCTFPPGLDCIGKASINSSGVVVVLANNQGHTINITNVNGTETTLTAYSLGSGAGNITTGVTDLAVQNNQKVTISCLVSLTSGEKFKDDLRVTYTDSETGLQHIATGTVIGKIA